MTRGRQRRTAAALAVCLLGVVMLSLPAAAAQNAPLISPDDLKAMLGKPGLVIIDVRQPKDFDSSNRMIKGAVRQDPGQVEAWAPQYAPGQEIVLYCA